jgi:CRISPR/Cas system-associated endonuclease Cas1
MDYSTKRGRLILPEYGRNIQRMVEYIKTIDDRDTRNQAAQEIINIMGNMNPHLRDINDFKHKLWDQLAQMADFNMDIDSPYPTPQRETFESKPNKVAYTTGSMKYRYMGRIMQKLIKAATKIEDKEKKDELVKIITNHMKKLYMIWNKDTVEDTEIFEKLRELSNGELAVEDGTRLMESKEIMSKKRKIKKKPFPRSQS